MEYLRYEMGGPLTLPTLVPLQLREAVRSRLLCPKRHSRIHGVSCIEWPARVLIS